MIKTIPNVNILTQEITEITYPTKTYKIQFADPDNSVIPERIVEVKDHSVLGAAVVNTMILGNDKQYKIIPQQIILDKINGYTDDLEAIAQAIYLILGTERYQFIIYSWDYGIELVDLYGKPMPYVMSELPRRITEALTQDDRIEDVIDFEFEVNGKKLHTTFTAVTNKGNITTELEVVI